MESSAPQQPPADEARFQVHHGEQESTPPGHRTVACEHADHADYVSVAHLFSALAAPWRAAIVHRLTEQDWNVTELGRALGISQPLVSQHLRVLRELRIVRAVRTGRSTTYSLADQHVAHIFLDAFAHVAEPVAGQATPAAPETEQLEHVTF